MNNEDKARTALLSGKVVQAGLIMSRATSGREVRAALLNAAKVFEETGMPSAATDFRTLEKVSSDSYLFSIKDSITEMLAEQAKVALDAALGG